MADEQFDLVAKTLYGLEDVLADELRALGAEGVETGRRMVAFRGDKAMLYKANFHCRTALRILKPVPRPRMRSRRPSRPWSGSDTSRPNAPSPWTR